MRKNFYPEGRLNALILMEQNNLLADRLRFAKASIDSNCPKTFDIFRKNIPKSQEKTNMSNSFIINNIYFYFFNFSEKLL